jgi:WD40 repeat protein
VTATFGSSDAEIWDATSGRRLALLPGQDGEIRTLDFSPDSRRILVGSIFAPARLYDCDFCGDAGDLLRLARREVPRELTPEERQRYGIP